MDGRSSTDDSVGEEEGPKRCEHGVGGGYGAVDRQVVANVAGGVGGNKKPHRGQMASGWREGNILIQ